MKSKDELRQQVDLLPGIIGKGRVELGVGSRHLLDLSEEDIEHLDCAVATPQEPATEAGEEERLEGTT
jgi:hypothetical protein